VAPTVVFALSARSMEPQRYDGAARHVESRADWPKAAQVGVYEMRRIAWFGLGDISWGKIIAIGLGVSIALWLLGGDRTPEAATSFDVMVTRISVADGIEFYRIGGGVLAVDSDLPIAQWLRTHRGKATLSLEAK
jgi:hypothetical protein